MPGLLRVVRGILVYLRPGLFRIIREVRGYLRPGLLRNKVGTEPLSYAGAVAGKLLAGGIRSDWSIRSDWTLRSKNYVRFHTIISGLGC